MNRLPDYAERLAALHAALADDFRRIIADLPLTGGETCIDAGCGDGFFAGLLAERLDNGTTIALDNSPAYLAVCRRRLAAHSAASRTSVVEGDVAAMPFDAASVDAVWSVHSMQSYADIPRVLREFRRVLRPGGLLAVLESDSVHSIMLSWPPDLELSLRQAEQRQIGDEDSYIGAYFPRFAQRLLREAGYHDITRQYMFLSRQRPCGAMLERYIELYLKEMLEQHGPGLSERAQARLAALASPDAAQFLPRQENFFFGSLQVLLTARA
ncbi:MAG: hypothetical protein DCC67_16075 [Planctomycetota bacterium]|nr:MAG: hypothetical protein DCC67_16075 [Planctomycetota bacterium]